MTPTAKFRWLEMWTTQAGGRHPSVIPVAGMDGRRVLVLQQWWIDEESEIESTFEGEWRDIPIEEEA